MADLYIDTDTGSDSNGGTSFADGLLTHAQAVTLAHATLPTTVYVRGSAPTRKDTLTYTKPITFVYTRSSAATGSVMHKVLGSATASSGWTQVGDEWRRTFTFVPVDVGYNIINTVDASGSVTGTRGARYGLYAPGTFGALNEGEWASSGSAPTVTVSIRPASGHSAPNDSAATPYEIFRAAAGLEPTSLVNCGVYGPAEFIGHLDRTKGMHVCFYQCQNCVMADLQGHMSWDHAFSFQGSGGATTNNRMENITAWSNGTGSLFASFNASTTIPMRGQVYRNVLGHANRLKRHDGADHNSNTIGGFICHSGSGAIIDDMTWDGCVIHDYGTGGNPWVCNTTARDTLTGDPEEPSSYALKLIDCEVIGGAGAARCNFNSGSVARVRCRFDIGGQTGTIAIEFQGVTSLNVCCLDIGNLNTSTSDRICSVRSNATTRWRNCGHINAGTTLGSNRCVFRALGTATQTLAIDCREGLLHNTETLIHSGTFTASQLIFQNNIYKIAGANGYNGLSKANWQSQVDTSANSIYDLDPEIVDPMNRGGIGRAGGLLRTAKLPVAFWNQKQPVGLNRRKYSGHYGPDQWGDIAAVETGGGIARGGRGRV